jgi:competence protein ComEA
MRLPSFNPREIKAIFFILASLLIGGGITLYKNYHSDFAPELLGNRDKAVSIPVDSMKETKDSTKILSQKLKEKININTASAQELELIPGIGPVLSQRILKYRMDMGRFQNIEELKKIYGIGENKFEQIKEYVTVK